MTEITAGYCQTEPELGQSRTTIKRISGLLEKAEEFDLIVLPELCNSGYRFENQEHARSLAENPETSLFVEFLIEKCRENQAHVVTGFNELCGDLLYNSALLIGPEGIQGKYRKIHLFQDEKSCFEPGNLGLPVFEICGVRLGMLVCFDWIFPETWRILALRGADVIAHPSNLVLPGLAQRSVPVMAMMNRIFIITCNRIGCEGELQFTGMSTIADPKGGILHQAGQHESAVKMVTMDIAEARDKMVTPRNHVFRDRHPEEYTSLSKSDSGHA